MPPKCDEYSKSNLQHKLHPLFHTLCEENKWSTEEASNNELDRPFYSCFSTDGACSNIWNKPKKRKLKPNKILPNSKPASLLFQLWHIGRFGKVDEFSQSLFLSPQREQFPFQRQSRLGVHHSRLDGCHVCVQRIFFFIGCCFSLCGKMDKLTPVKSGINTNTLHVLHIPVCYKCSDLHEAASFALVEIKPWYFIYLPSKHGSILYYLHRHQQLAVYPALYLI